MNAERALLYNLFILSHTSLAQGLSLIICHPRSYAWAHLFDSFLPFYFYLLFPVFFFSFHVLHSELYPELDNPIVMESLRYSANKGSDDAYDVSTSLTGYEPNCMAFSELGDSQSSFSFINPSSDQDMDDVTLGKLLTEAHRGQADYFQPEGVSVSQSSSSVVFDGLGKPAGERNVDQSVGFGVTRNTYSAHSKFSENTQAEKVVDRSGKPEERNSSNAQIRTLLEEQRQMIIAEYREKVGHHALHAAHAEEERRLLQGQLWRQKFWNFVKPRQQSLTEMEELRKFQSSTFDTMARRKLIEDQNTILKLSGRVQELQSEVNCIKDSKDFQDAESVRSGNSHVTSRPVSFPPHPIPEGLLKQAFVSPCRREGPPSIWDTHGISGNVFVNPDASSSAPYPQDLNQWNSSTEEPLHSSTVEKSERPEQNQDLRCQSGPSAKNSVIFSGGGLFKRLMGQTNNDCRFQTFTLTSSLHQQTFACWKIRFKTEVCTCSQFPMEAMQWIKEVELVDSVDDLKFSSSIKGFQMPKFEVLDARIASALNKIIHNSHFKRRISLEEQQAQKQDSFPSWQTDCLLDLRSFPGHWDP